MESSPCRPASSASNLRGLHREVRARPVLSAACGRTTGTHVTASAAEPTFSLPDCLRSPAVRSERGASAVVQSSFTSAAYKATSFFVAFAPAKATLRHSRKYILEVKML